ncbi:MAG: DUF3604 domain-containing protein [Acidobacteria bacterium]|nr:DUF3604 domain-containing protein [Acidobacteriota bacterium]
MKKALLAVVAASALVWLAPWKRRPVPVHAALESPAACCAFQITFGQKRKVPGINWSGGVRDAAQVRRILGWHLDETDSIVPPNRWNVSLRAIGNFVPPKGVIIDILTPPGQPVTFFTRTGDVTFVPGSIPYGVVYTPPQYNGDVTIERVPVPVTPTSKEFEDDDPALLRSRNGRYWMAWVAYKTRARDEYSLTGADEILISRSSGGAGWSTPESITPPGDHFRVQLAEDARGRIWAIYGLQKKMESGNFDLFAKVWDGERWSAEQQLTNNANPDIFHRAASTRDGVIYLTWMGYRGSPAQSEILLKVFENGNWSSEMNVSASADDDWEPSLGVAANGQAHIAWDSYRRGGRPVASYDILMRSYQKAVAAGAVRPVAQTSFAEMRADVAADSAGRVWIAWEEGGINWGKDTGYENAKHRIKLRKGGYELYGPPNSQTALYRRPRVAVLAGDQLQQPANIATAYPDTLQKNLWQNPRLAVDGSGRAWLLLRHQTIAVGRFAGHMFDYYATTLTGEGAAQKWMNPVLLPASTGRQDTATAAVPGPGEGFTVAVVGDGRRLPVGLPENHEITVAQVDPATLSRGLPALAAFQPAAEGNVPVTHPEEEEAVRRMRGYRIQAGGATYKIVRGDIHRHTEISMDGATDGSLWDLYRYALNAAAFDYIAVTDHNYGAWLDTDEPEGRNTDDIYQYWRTQKSADLFHVPGRFTPLYGYERSINFPLGHRNIIHVKRGVFSYRVPRLHVSERPDLIEKDAQGLWAYLRRTAGVGVPHTSATSMGTDWRLRDDGVEPVTEIYQGDRNSYEDEGQPRAALPDATGPGEAGRQPFQKGLIWNALGVGYKMGFIASSDHLSTHISYANLIVPDGVTTREAIQEALRARRTYASTDNIIVDFRAGDVLQGGELTARSSPTFTIRATGTAPILRYEIIKNNKVIYSAAPGTEAVLTYRDDSFANTDMIVTSQIKNWEKPETGIRPRPKAPVTYYYVRVIQSYSAEEKDVEGEIAWSSPIFVGR